MEPISKTMNRLLSSMDSKPFERVESRDYLGQGGTPEPEQCKHCGAMLYHKGARTASGRIYWSYTPERCGCAGAIAEYEKTSEDKAKRAREEADQKMRNRVAKIIGDSGMGRRFLQRRFENFEITPDNEKAVKQAMDYAAHFAAKLPEAGDPGQNGLFIIGPKGTGKTHLAAAIANRLMEQGTAVICMTMIDLLERIRATFRQTDGINEGEVLRVYKTVPLLIIDDMGKEPATEWAVSTIYNIVNGRYEAYMPTIITSNYGGNALIRKLTPSHGDDTTADAMVDRLREMCVGVVLNGKSRRQMLTSGVGRLPEGVQ